MSWKFKVSKFKNAAPRFPKREGTILEVPVGALMASCGNHIAASCNYMAFNVDSGGGGNLGILQLDKTGRIGQSQPILKAHADYVTDMMFSPFHDDVLATCSADCTVKVWTLPEQERLPEHINTCVPSASLPGQQRRIENVSWNPVADGVLAASTSTSVKIFDVETSAEKYDLSCHGDQIQSICWHGNGTLMASTCKDKKFRTLDPRTSSVAQECFGHQSNKDSRAVWMGNKDCIVSTGFSMGRERELKIWDSRNLKSALHTTNLGSNTGTPMPLLDVDTNMLLVVGKGDTSWCYAEVSSSDPYVTQNSQERTEKSEQVKGACLIPKRAVNVMEGEVDRLLLLLQNSIIPLPYIVPRKQYKDFHADLFPDTKCEEAALTSGQWFDGKDDEVELMSLNPDMRSTQKKEKVKDKEQTGSKSNKVQMESPKVEVKSADSVQNTEANSPSVPSTASSSSRSSGTASSRVTPAAAKPEPVKMERPTEPSKSSKSFAALHLSKCKYIKGTTEHPSTHIVNIRRLCRTLPGQSNIFYANSKRCAVPIEGAGGLVAVLELDKTGRLPDTGVPVLQNGSKVNDFIFDPFDDNRLLVGCDNAKVYIWKIPEGGLTETLTESESYLMGHREKIYFVRFHPLARDIVLTASYDMTIKIWDLTDTTEKMELTGHEDEIFCAEWSPDGKLVASVCKDGKVRIFDSRKSTQPIKEGAGPDGGRGARVIWALNMKYLFISGFKKSNRQLSIYSVDKLAEPLYSLELEVSPAILVPHYDEGTSTVLLTGRGDGVIEAYEVSDEYPHLFLLSPIKTENSHQGIALMPKTTCNVRNIEIARTVRLTQTTVEPMSFTLPRSKPEFFQDDLFPDTVKPGVPTMSSSEWFNGANKQPVRISLRPSDMKPLSEAPKEAPKARKYDSYNPDTYKTDDMKKEELISAVTNKLGTKDTPLPQDIAEGVDSDEWEDD